MRRRTVQSPPAGPRRSQVSTRTRTVPINPLGRDLVVGDVHGCFRTLERALVDLEFDARRDRLFGVGDLVDRGPHSIEAVDWLGWPFAAVACGNHERAVLGWLESARVGPPPAGSEWLRDVPPSQHRRWRDAIGAMPFAITIETAYGPIGVVHAEAPKRVWTRALELLESGSPSAVDDVLLGLPVTTEQRAQIRSKPVEDLRALVHGHFPVSAVEASANRWNIDTGAGITAFNRLSLLEVNHSEFRSWTVDVREAPQFPAGARSSTR